MKDLENAKQINYVDPNREIFEVNYNDELFEQNIKKISKIAKKLISQNKCKEKEPFKNLVIKKEINFELLKKEKKIEKKEEDDDEEYEEEEEEEEDDLDDVDIDLNIPINKNLINAKRIEISKPSGLNDKDKLNTNKDNNESNSESEDNSLDDELTKKNNYINSFTILYYYIYGFFDML